MKNKRLQRKSFLRGIALVVLAANILFSFTLSLVAFAEENGGNKTPEYKTGTLLPQGSPEFSVEYCKSIMQQIEENYDDSKAELFENNGFITSDEDAKDISANDVLACGIKTGQIPLWMVPYYVKYVLEFVIGISGLIAVGGTMYGGYLYLFAGLSDDKDKGKKAILYGISGFILTLLAWALVNIVISLVTSL